MKVAVAGAGIFGLTCAFKLAEAGHKIELYDENGLLNGASKTNQFRMHRGYHYPRSKKTALACKEGYETFRPFYDECMLDCFTHIYAIAKEGSLISPEQFTKFCEDLDLEYRLAHPNVINWKNIDVCFEVIESMLSPSRLREFCQRKLKDLNLDITFWRLPFQFSNLDLYDLVVNATYASQNYLDGGTTDYQFELVEQAFVTLPSEYKDFSILVADGPFMCIDPYDETGKHLLLDVEESVHARRVGKYPQHLRYMMYRPSKFKQMIKSAKRFFVDIEKAVYHESMYGIRTVLPNHDHDDARPTVIKRHGRVISVFGGKIPTCVDAANKVLELV